MFSPILDADSAAYVHHMILFACEAGSHESGKGKACDLLRWAVKHMRLFGFYVYLGLTCASFLWPTHISPYLQVEKNSFLQNTVPIEKTQDFCIFLILLISNWMAGNTKENSQPIKLIQ